jgi:hypothetical protein
MAHQSGRCPASRCIRPTNPQRVSLWR